MRNGAVLVAVVSAGLVNAVDLDVVPLWRQMAFVVVAAAAYLHGRHLPVRRAWPVFLAAVGVSAGFALVDVSTGVGMVAMLALFVGSPWLVGRSRRQQHDLVVAGRERVAHLERERELVAAHAALRERTRIASELHDALGHELALLSLRAGALELAPGLTAAHQQAAAEVRAGAVAATDRLREVVGVLRENDGGEPSPTVAELVTRARAAGMEITADLPSRPLRGDVHRVVREALTNAARHASGAAVSVRVREDADGLCVTVSNSHRGAAAHAGTGTGLTTLRSSLAATGATLSVADDGEHFTVTAHWPGRA
jgi:signal transduction histidine kinase